MDNLETITFWTSVGVAVPGLVALVLVWFFWERVASLYRELWAKLGVAFFRFVAAASAVASKSVAVPAGMPLREQSWVLPTLIAVAGYLFWEAAGAIGDYRLKQAKERTRAEHDLEIEALTQDKEDAEQQFLRLGWVLSHLRALVSEKLRRVKDTVRSSTASRGSLPQTRGALAPEQQLRMILESLALLFRTQVVSSGGPFNQNFRIGLYTEQGGRLAPLDAFDLNTRRHDPFSSYQVHADRFRLDNAVNPSHAVRCVLEGRMLIVPDCAYHPDFQYFNSQQYNYLRSMVAYPLPDFSPEGATPVRAALLIDTDVAGYFQEEDREMIEVYLKEFAARVELEYAIRGLTS
jgi:hypothetical protein